MKELLADLTVQRAILESHLKTVVDEQLKLIQQLAKERQDEAKETNGTAAIPEQGIESGKQEVKK